MFMTPLTHSRDDVASSLPTGHYNEPGGELGNCFGSNGEAYSSSFGNRSQLRKSDRVQLPYRTGRKMDKIAGLREILALDPKNSFARYGLAMELAGRRNSSGSG
jgi:hypothetical protein